MTGRKEWLWSVLELIFWLVPFTASYRVAIWITAKPMSELPTSVQLPGCPAFRFSHGAYFCEPLGTTQSHPALFIGAVLAILASLAFALYIYFSGLSGSRSFAERVVDVMKARFG